MDGWVQARCPTTNQYTAPTHLRLLVVVERELLRKGRLQVAAAAHAPEASAPIVVPAPAAAHGPLAAEVCVFVCVFCGYVSMWCLGVCTCVSPHTFTKQIKSITHTRAGHPAPAPLVVAPAPVAPHQRAGRALRHASGGRGGRGGGREGVGRQRVVGRLLVLGGGGGRRCLRLDGAEEGLFVWWCWCCGGRVESFV